MKNLNLRYDKTREDWLIDQCPICNKEYPGTTVVGFLEKIDISYEFNCMNCGTNFFEFELNGRVSYDYSLPHSFYTFFRNIFKNKLI